MCAACSGGGDIDVLHCEVDVLSFVVIRLHVLGPIVFWGCKTFGGVLTILAAGVVRGFWFRCVIVALPVHKARHYDCERASMFCDSRADLWFLTVHFVVHRCSLWGQEKEVGRLSATTPVEATAGKMHNQCLPKKKLHTLNAQIIACTAKAQRNIA